MDLSEFEAGVAQDRFDCGVDLDVLEMALDDVHEPVKGIPDEHQQDYLLGCRRRLMNKVQYYREQVEMLRLKEADMTKHHRDQIKRLQHFYHNIALCNGRSAKIVRNGISSGEAAAQIMRELKSK